MKSNELRIGNYVNTRNPKQNPFRVDFFDESKVYKHNGTYEVPGIGTVPFHELTWDLEDVSGIPLTPKILEKCGSEKTSNGIYRLKQGWHWITFDSYSVYIGGKQYVLIDYLHQFQNLIFALTGTELQINLNENNE